ncbi:MAG: FecR domain-containing protein, partial [Lachnospiraceae bacterium]|nr:FecR domain-containing protein [Lachnospiraceae bacterium]
MTKKVWVMIGAVVAAAAAVVVACVVLIGGKNEAYRSIMVYQINGNATITRERVGEMAAYENLMLQSGDMVAVASDSSMRLKLDDDKYVLAEQDTLMNIVAEGNDENARTFIDLQKGSVTSEIQNKLKDGASYEVNTPNSIMAVRGTIFRVDVEIDENKNTNTKLTVFQGTVGVRTIMPDGTVSEEEIKVEAGNELTVEGTPTTSEYSGEPVEIDYDSLPEIIQDYIEELAQSGMKPGRDVVVNTSKAQEPEPENAEETLQDSEKQPETKPESELEEEAEEAEQEKSEQPESARLQRKQPETTAKTQEQQPEPESQNA